MNFLEKAQQVIGDLAPYIESHGGAIDIVKSCEDSGEVHVELKGACTDCPISHITLKHGIEDEMRKRIPEFKKLINITS